MRDHLARTADIAAPPTSIPSPSVAPETLEGIDRTHRRQQVAVLAETHRASLRGEPNGGR